ncbi:hypothetical protein F4821DRAFT_258469 [Hypoxylon rubiginosum]|uniref:Uncharacterized protein n=1 Tax=Hypoxylon rubiginosum TaxID=110542 RepID=A0ACC0D666_9PEZI|nr:hypothetical protein F4821DRAFT_258469 [Hypoxylon rubiginosum]
MCTHSKIIYGCNHSHTSAYPVKPCRRQHEFEKGQRTLPCDEVWTHGRNNWRVARQCDYCEEKKTRLDRRFDYAKIRLAELRAQLERAYTGCTKHMEDAGLGEKRPSSTAGSESSTTTTSTTGTGTRRSPARDQRRKPVASSIGTIEEETAADPVQEFLKKKMQESDAHLMMLSSN